MSEEIQNIKKALFYLSQYLQVELTDMQLVMYANELKKDGFVAVVNACNAVKASTNSYYGKFPTPSQLREALVGANDDYALETALKIIKAVGKFGYVSPMDAKLYIGLLGWDVVEAYGGWQTVCRSIDGPEKIGIFQSQFQKTAKMLINSSQRPSRDGEYLSSSETRKHLNEPKEEPVSLGAIIGRLHEQDKTPKG